MDRAVLTYGKEIVEKKKEEQFRQFHSMMYQGKLKQTYKDLNLLC
jgi:hypothetical protein